MILIISVCSEEISEFEFVVPIKDLLKSQGQTVVARRYFQVSENDLREADKVIICGTALKDLEYLNNVDQFLWLRDYGKPFLGICAGMQILARIFECKLVDKTMIGQFRVRIVLENKLVSGNEFNSYFLNSKAIEVGKHFVTLAESERLECIVKHKTKELYGCLFHPEVFNPQIILNFSNSI
jgi:GMP synthase (glutamine-hydrolysing)